MPKNTMYSWVEANRLGNLDLGAGSQTPQSAMTLNEELIQLRVQVKEVEKENRHLKADRDFTRTLQTKTGHGNTNLWQMP